MFPPLQPTACRTPLCGQLEAAPAVCLHVSHPADGLDLGVVGSPLIPVLESAHFKDVLVATVPRVLVAHPPARRRDGSVDGALCCY